MTLIRITLSFWEGVFEKDHRKHSFCGSWRRRSPSSSTSWVWSWEKRHKDNITWTSGLRDQDDYVLQETRKETDSWSWLRRHSLKSFFLFIFQTCLYFLVMRRKQWVLLKNFFSSKFLTVCGQRRPSLIRLVMDLETRSSLIRLHVFSRWWLE